MNDRIAVWALYREVYSDYLMALHQIEILTLASQEVLRDLPRNLPEALREKLNSKMRELVKSFSEARESPDKVWRFQVENPDVTDKLAGSIFLLYYAFLPSDRRPSVEETTRIVDATFERLLNAQALIMLFAYLDAFMADSLRVVCQVRPEVMTSERKIDWTWNAALEVAKTEELMSYLVDQYVLEFGFLSIPKRVEYFRNKPFCFDMKCSDEVKILGDAENLRHIAVHNGGKVSQEYLKRTQRKDIQVGEYVPVPHAYLERVIAASTTLAADLFTAIGSKYFSSEPQDIAGIFRQAVFEQPFTREEMEALFGW